MVFFNNSFRSIIYGISCIIYENSYYRGTGDKEKKFTSIQVKKGDSLWSIAKEHMGDEYDTVDDYIDEVCETNHIYDRQITDGMYLVIPYYTVRR